MAFKLILSNTVRFPVKGTLTNEAGESEAFDFHLIAKRIDTDALEPPPAADGQPTPRPTIDDVLRANITGWDGLLGADDKPLPFSADALGQLLKVFGMSGLCFQAFTAASGAKSGN